MANENGDLGPVLLKFGVALAFSFGGIFYSFLMNKRIKSSESTHDSRKHSDCKNQVNSGTGSWTSRSDLHFDPLITDKHEDLRHLNIPVPDLPPSNRSNGDKNAYLLPEFNELVKELDATDMKTNMSPMKDTDIESSKGYPRVEKNTHEQEIKSLRNLVKILKERESNLEIQLLEYYGLKEQETAVMELQNRFKLNNMEAKLFALKIESLQADNKRLEAQMADYTKSVTELEAARAKIKTLKRKLRSETEQNKKQILDFQEKVQKMQQNEHTNVVGIDHENGSSQNKLKNLEAEVEELKKSNHNLQLEKSEMARRLDCLQILATSVLEDGETETLREENQKMKKQNEELSQEVERLKADRCGDLEELVYLRWINACLRYEVRNYQPKPGKMIARDLSKSLSPRSEEKAKKLILEYANKEGTGEVPEIDSDQWSSSQASVIMDSGELDESPINAPLPQKSTYKFFGKLMRVLRGKDSHHHHHHHHNHHQPPRSHSRNSSLERSESGDNDWGSSYENQTLRTSFGGSFQRLAHRHSTDACFLKQIDSIAEGGGGNGDEGECGGDGSGSTSSDGKKSKLLKYAEALKDTRSKSHLKLHKSSPSLIFY